MTLPSVAVRLVSNAVMSEDCEVLTPSADVTRVSRPEIADVLVATLVLVLVTLLFRDVIEVACEVLTPSADVTRVSKSLTALAFATTTEPMEL